MLLQSLCSLRLSSHQVNMLLSSLWIQATSTDNTPENFEAMASTYQITLLFSLAKVSRYFYSSFIVYWVLDIPPYQRLMECWYYFILARVGNSTGNLAPDILTLLDQNELTTPCFWNWILWLRTLILYAIHLDGMVFWFCKIFSVFVIANGRDQITWLWCSVFSWHSLFEISHWIKMVSERLWLVA